MGRKIEAIAWLFNCTLGPIIGGFLVHGGAVGVAVLLLLNFAHVGVQSPRQRRNLSALLVLIQIVPFWVFVKRQFEIASSGLWSFPGLCIFGTVFAAPLVINALIMGKTSDTSDQVQKKAASENSDE
jgi:hypothetical protein